MYLLDEPMRFFLRDEWCAEAGVPLPALEPAEAAAILADLENALWNEVVVGWHRELPAITVERVPADERDAWKARHLHVAGPVAEPFGPVRHAVHLAAKARVDVAAIVARHLGG